MTLSINQPMNFDEIWFDNVSINSHAINRSCESLERQIKCLDTDQKIEALLKTIRVIDLTTLAGDDTYVNVQRLCYRGLNPLTEPLLKRLESCGFCDENLTVGAICVYPSRIKDCHESFKMIKPSKDPLKIASVVTGFPSGQYGLDTRLSEIGYARNCGADEVDTVIDRSLALNGDWKKVYEEVKQMRLKASTMKLKVILEVGELGSLANVYKASWAAMLAGADFIKTSTGKVSVNATLPVGFVMTRAIYEFYSTTGVKVGFKPAGGLRTDQDCFKWLKLIENELGDEWLSPNLFRIGASSLLNQVEKSLFKLVFGREPASWELSL
ncbi:deoxyribose-phosphate aldolase isoform X2 [Tetranychus urticae]|uniref:deoxyribose-phosphate aldolase n=1 Tax=Tetranychus urticae TaxID=32264 RepID=T1KTX2_TETUR|nr:deoxyribose-phosphate aldolase isoform X2 [Tetranychus urticae]